MPKLKKEKSKRNEENGEIFFNVRKNMTFLDYIRSKFLLLIIPFEALQNYRKVYKNYFHVLFNHYRNNYPINVKLKNGKIENFRRRYQTRIVSLGIDNYCHFQNDILTIKNDHLPEIKFIDSGENGDLYSVFFKEEYSFLPVENRVVIDIGSNIADSSIYFALKGAKKVIGIEPLPKNYNQAKKNIMINNLSNKILLINVGISDKKGLIKINSEKSGTTCFLEKDDNNGTDITLMTLEDIIRSENSDLVLKMDCEGYEYNAILSTPNKILKKFSHIQIEYHFGYKNLKKKLEVCGFKVSVSKPQIGANLLSNKLRSYVVFIYAEQIR